MTRARLQGVLARVARTVQLLDDAAGRAASDSGKAACPDGDGRGCASKLLSAVAEPPVVGLQVRMLRHKPPADAFAGRFVPRALVAAAEVSGRDSTADSRRAAVAAPLVLLLSTIEAAAMARVRRDAAAKRLPIVTQVLFSLNALLHPSPGSLYSVCHVAFSSIRRVRRLIRPLIRRTSKSLRLMCCRLRWDAVNQ